MRRFHNFSRSSRYRIRKLVQSANRNGAIPEPSSSDSDEEMRVDNPRQRRRIFRVADRNLHLPNAEHHTDVEDNNSELSEASRDDSYDEGENGALLENNHNEAAGVEPLSGSDTGDRVEGDANGHGIANSGNEEENRRLSLDSADDSEINNQSNVDDEDFNEAQDIEFEDVGVGGQHDVDHEHQPEDDYGWDMAHDVPIYDMAPISLGESALAIISFYMRHNLSQTGLKDLLTLINLHCREENNHFLKSMWQLDKFFANVQFPIVRHFYCSVCFQTVPHADAICRQNHVSGTDYFIQISSVISQLNALYNRPGFIEKLYHKSTRRHFINGNYEDIYDASVYRELSEVGEILSNPDNISLMWYTDGVSVFNSSKSEIWPFYFVINELPYNERTKVSNALLAGLWFGKSKPDPATLLKPIRDDLLKLRQGIIISYGINPVKAIIVKGIVICGTADIPAEAKFLNFKAHNSTFGCAKCKIPSRNIRRGLNVYPFIENTELRTEHECSMHAAEVMQLPLVNGMRQDVFGVKGPTILSNFVHQWVRTTSVDEMHCCFLGVAKSLVHLWFDSKFSDKSYSLSAHKGIVNRRLSAISPPNFVQRLTRNLDDAKYWKAHELRTFLFYFSLPVLSDLMSCLYLNHNMLLVYGVYLLNQRSISEHQVNTAAQLLSEYVSQFEDLYGIENMTCNFHQLLHLSGTVQDLGPLWVTSCFPFEDMNGKLKKLVKGTRYAELQVCRGVSMLLKLAELNSQIPDNSKSSVFIKNLFDSNRNLKLTSIGHRMSIVGKYVKQVGLPPFIERALQNSDAIGRNCYEFYRMMKHCIIYGSELYGRVVKTKSNCVKYKHGLEEGFGFIDRFIRLTDCNCADFCGGCEAKYFAIVRKCETQLEFTALDDIELHFLHTFLAVGDCVAIELQDIICMCFVVDISDRDRTYIVQPVNMIEAE